MLPQNFPPKNIRLKAVWRQWTGQIMLHFALLIPSVSHVHIYSVHINLWSQQQMLWLCSFVIHRPLRVCAGPRPSVRRINGSLIIDYEEEKILLLALKQMQYKVWKSDCFYAQCTYWPSGEQSAESKTSDGRNWRQHVRWAAIDNSVSAAMEKT